MKFYGDLIALNSFGFGGANVHTVIKANSKESNDDSFQLSTAELPRLVAVCGRTDEGIEHSFNFIEKNMSKVTKEFLALVDDAMKIKPSNRMNKRGFAF